MNHGGARKGCPNYKTKGNKNMTEQKFTQTEIKTMAAIIESCTQRGAFRAAELVVVGNLFSKLTSMIVPEPKNTNPAAELNKNGPEG